MQKDKAELVEAFKQIAPLITTEIVMQAALFMGCHYATVQRYLRGEVKKEQFGKKLLAYLESLNASSGDEQPTK